MAARAKESDPPTQLRELAQLLGAQARLPRGFVVRGEERYFREAALAQLAAAAAQRGLEACKHDAQDPDFDLAAACDDLAGSPLFASARAVFVRNAGALLKKEEERASRLTRALLAFIERSENGGDGGFVAIDAESLRADHAVCKAVAQRGGPVLACRRLYLEPPPWNPDPRNSEVVAWLQARAKELGIALDGAQAAYVAAATGNDLSALDTALENVRRRGAQSLQQSVGWSSAVSPFKLAEELARGDAARALPGIEGLFRQGMTLGDGSRAVDHGAVIAVLFGTLRGKLRQTLAAARARASGADIASVLSPQQRNNRNAVAELEARLARRPAAQWSAMLDDLGRLERQARAGEGASVGVDDLALFALRWRVAPERAAPARRAPYAPPR